MDVEQSNLNGGKLLAELRRRYDLTQSELAKRAAVSRSMVAQLEIGERRPSQKLIRTLCRAMNAAADDERQLMLAYEFRPTGETPEQITAFLRADKNLTPDQAERIAALVRKAYENAVANGQGTE
jgi:transcriptional regulator with XRE-family HTH domain